MRESVFKYACIIEYGVQLMHNWSPSVRNSSGGKLGCIENNIFRARHHASLFSLIFSLIMGRLYPHEIS